MHHGNGTEEIVKALVPQRKTLPLPASWAPIQYDEYKPWLSEDDAKHVFFGESCAWCQSGCVVLPLLGDEGDRAEEAKQTGAWRDPLSPSGSINLVDGTMFYPGSGSDRENDFVNHPNIVNVELTPIKPGCPGDRKYVPKASVWDEPGCRHVRAW